MSSSEETYTYQGGQKVPLRKRPDEFVVRASPEQVAAAGVAPASQAEQVSAASTRVTAQPGQLESQMSDARQLAPTHHAYESADTGQEFLITDRVFVTFREPLAAEQVDEFAGRYALVKLECYSDREYLFQLTDHTGMNPVKLVVKLMESEPLVELADHDRNYRATTSQLPLPTDPVYARQWHLHRRFSHPDFDPRASARCEEAWQLLESLGSPDVVVGVTDDGCKLDHGDFDTPGRFAGWGYFEGERLVTNVDVGANPARMYQTGANHGTSCAGVIAAEVDAALTVGAAPGCRLLPIKWESSGPSLFISASKIRRVLDFLADKVDVLSNSWGIVPTQFYPAIVTNRIAELARTGGRRGRGIVFLWAAGNENCPIQHTTNLDVPHDDGFEVRPDGSAVWVGVSTARSFQNSLVGLPGLMHVAALASTAQRSHYSNYGTGISLCAPTSNSHEYHRLTVRGLGIATTTGAAGSVTERFGGTSSATPLVAGVAALVISANPNLSAEEVVALLKRTASKDLRQEGYPRTPPASFDPNPTWDISPIAPFDRGDFRDISSPDGTWSAWFGHGRVDAAAAVAAALQRPPTPAPEPPRRRSFTSSPARSIPDNKPEGIREIIPVSATGRLRDLRVEVKIQHTWIGDLRVRLTAPDDTSVLLHDRSGASQVDLHRSYDPTSLPALAGLLDRAVRGDWLLEVFDLAARDVGRLEAWALDMDLVDQPVVVRDRQATRIPDNNLAGVTRTLSLPAGLLVEDLAISVDITHPWIGDLQVTLTPPGASPIRLHDRAGRDGDNIVRTWQAAELPALNALRGRDAGGDWTLQVADVAQQDEGKLNTWQIEVVGQPGVASAAAAARPRSRRPSQKPARKPAAAGAAPRSSRRARGGNDGIGA
jgi:subtilisin-like proprotein convertase family protein/subtilisin family serine protease